MWSNTVQRFGRTTYIWPGGEHINAQHPEDPEWVEFWNLRKRAIDARDWDLVNQIERQIAWNNSHPVQ